MAWGTVDGIPGRKSAGSRWISGKGGAMRLSWKLFFITTPIFVLFLTIFGIWIIQDSFDHSLSQAVEECMAENQTFQNSYELTNHALSEAQWNQTTIKKVVASFHKSREAGDGNARIYDSDGSISLRGQRIGAEAGAHSIQKGHPGKRSGSRRPGSGSCQS